MAELRGPHGACPVPVAVHAEACAAPSEAAPPSSPRTEPTPTRPRKRPAPSQSPEREATLADAVARAAKDPEQLDELLRAIAAVAGKDALWGLARHVKGDEGFAWRRTVDGDSVRWDTCPVEYWDDDGAADSAEDGPDSDWDDESGSDSESLLSGSDGGTESASNGSVLDDPEEADEEAAIAQEEFEDMFTDPGAWDALGSTDAERAEAAWDAVIAAEAEIDGEDDAWAVACRVEDALRHLDELMPGAATPYENREPGLRLLEEIEEDIDVLEDEMEEYRAQADYAMSLQTDAPDLYEQASAGNGPDAEDPASDLLSELAGLGFRALDALARGPVPLRALRQLRGPLGEARSPSPPSRREISARSRRSGGSSSARGRASSRRGLRL